MKNSRQFVQLAEKGFSLIPIGKDKKPLIKWKKNQNHPFTQDEIQKFINNGVDRFAIIGGYSDILCLDIDTKNLDEDRSPAEFIDDFEDGIDLDIFCKLVVVETQSGGRHYIYRVSAHCSNQYLAKNTRGNPIIEIRGQGGYFVVPPSSGYTVLEGSILEIQELSPDEHLQLIEHSRSFDNPCQQSNRPSNEYALEMERLVESCLDQIEFQKKDLTSSYDQWIRIGFSFCNTFGERGREFFQRVSKHHPDYKEEECDKKYTELLIASFGFKGMRPVSIAAFFELCIDAGIEVEGQCDSKVSQKYRMVTGYLEGMQLRFNEFTRRTEIAGRGFEDRHLNSMYADLQQIGIAVSKEYINTLIQSNRVSPFHPIKDFLNECTEVDFMDELDRFLRCFILKEQDPVQVAFLLELLIKWLLQFFSVTYEDLPPRLVLVLIGPSHIGKTYALRHLLPKSLSDYYAESGLNRGKDSLILMSEKLLINNDEFGGIVRMNEMEQFKRMASAHEFDERRAFGRYNEKFIRRAVLCGTSNRFDIIADHTTGNTRLIPLDIVSIDHGLLNSIDKIKLFANLLHIYNERGLKCTELTFSETDQLQDYSKGFQTVNLEQEAILTVVEPGDEVFMTATEIADTIAQQFSIRINPKKISQEMRNMGFQQGRKLINKQHLRGWYVKFIPARK